MGKQEAAGGVGGGHPSTARVPRIQAGADVVRAALEEEDHERHHVKNFSGCWRAPAREQGE